MNHAEPAYPDVWVKSQDHTSQPGMCAADLDTSANFSPDVESLASLPCSEPASEVWLYHAEPGYVLKGNNPVGIVVLTTTSHSPLHLYASAYYHFLLCS